MSEDEIFIWDGKGSIMNIVKKGHVHSPEGKCLKNRYGRECDETELTREFILVDRIKRGKEIRAGMLIDIRNYEKELRKLRKEKEGK